MVEEQKEETAVNTMTQEEMSEAYDAFSKIIFQNLEKVLEKRPANPVRKFVSK